MSEYTSRTNAALAVALRRQYSNPLDVSAVFRCMADFEAYVIGNTGYSNASYSDDENAFLQKILPYAYDGQIAAVLDEDAGTATAYIIQKAGALGTGETLSDRYTQVGSSMEVDGSTIEISNGVLMIAGLSSVPSERTAAYQPTLDTNGNIVWSAVSETTVEGLSTLISALTDRVAAIEAAYIKDVTYVSDTGVFTFTLADGTTKEFDLAIEKVVANFEYDSESQALILTLADGTTQTVPLSDFITDYTAESDATAVQLAISAAKVISATLVDGGVTTAKIADSAVTTAKIGASAVTTAKIADANVTTAKIADGAVTEAKLSTELQTAIDGILTEDDVNTLIGSATIDANKVSGTVASASSATTAASADKVVGTLTAGGKTYNGSADVTIDIADLVTVDTALDTESTNPVTNAAVTAGINAAQSAADSAQSSADSAASAAADAQTTANTAVTNAATAQSTAEAAQSAADAAQTTANSASTAAANAATAASDAQSTADTALANAATAQSTAESAATAAATAQTTADSKQDKLTFDTTPTANSTNPVTSGGVYSAIATAKSEVEAEIPDVSSFITNAVTDLANYYTKSETYTKTEVDTALGEYYTKTETDSAIKTAKTDLESMISAIPQFAIEVVESLPTADISETTIYLVKSGSDTQNLYTEYIYINSDWEELGTQSVDLSGYATEAYVSTAISDFLTETQINTLLASYYTSSQVDTKLESYYTKTETDSAVGAVQDNVDAINESLEDTTVSGTYSVVSVNAAGIVVAGAQVIEVGAAEQTTPSDSLAVGGIFFKRI